MKVLVLGASGLIGSTIFVELCLGTEWDVFGSVRHAGIKKAFSPDFAQQLIAGVDVEQPEALVRVLDLSQPDVVINCVGLTKHQPTANDPLIAISMNTLFPHRLAAYCKLVRARLIHISTDCVFSGKKGNYSESDIVDALDVYGKSKALGEVNYPHAITLRTSTIGHELQSTDGLLNWFLSQQVSCRGFTRAVFSGLTTVELARVIKELVIPRQDMRGLYHVAGVPISKYDLLKLIAQSYCKSIEVVSDDTLVIDRSLNAERFRLETGYVAPDWPELIRQMNVSKGGGLNHEVQRY